MKLALSLLALAIVLVGALEFAFLSEVQDRFLTDEAKIAELQTTVAMQSNLLGSIESRMTLKQFPYPK